MEHRESLVHLRGGTTSVVLDPGSGVPTVAYWGEALLDTDVVDHTWRLLTTGPVAPASSETSGVVSLVPERGSGFLGHPGLEGRRADGTGWSPRFALAELTVTADRCHTRSVDPTAQLELDIDVAIDAHGVITVEASLTNTGADDYTVDHLGLSLALPQHADELLTFSGRWCGEFTPRRQPWTTGQNVIDNRAGRTSHDRVPAAFAGSAGFGHEHGDVWGIHLGWSGNSRITAEVLIDGTRHLQLGELLLPGEVVLAPGETYSTPKVYGSYGSAGLNQASQQFHRHLRDRPHWPNSDRPRKVGLNTWEAVYFNHDLETLQALADRAAEIGVERYVLDDGWFHGRRDDTAGLGDWWVDDEVWPDGLAPLIDHVRALGLEFGIWVEPEMVNPNSDTFRNHPDWVLTMPGYDPVLFRNQLVLDLGNPEVFAYLLDHLDRLLTDHDIGYVKWDMNRDLMHAGHEGRPGVHQQTIALYRLLDEIRLRHPSVEIESCSSGGARIDFEILQRTERVWTSDSNDALDRHTIQRGLGYLFPPEIMGAHIGPPRSHTTGRTHRLAFRAAAAFFGHLGVEWNLLDTTEEDRRALAAFISLHKDNRPLLHGGDTVRGDHPDPTVEVFGVVAPDAMEAIFSISQLSSQPSSKPGRVRLPGLLPDLEYTVDVMPLPKAPPVGINPQLPPWFTDGATASGNLLCRVGLALPILHPETTILLRVSAPRDAN